MRRRVAAAVVAAFALGGLLAACTSAASPVPSRSAAPALDERDQIVPSTPDAGPAVQQQTPTEVPNTTGIDGALAWDSAADGSAGALQHDHVRGPVAYAVTPPVGGPHDAVWMNAGVYTKPIPSERAVHNLEHGAVWITYRPSLGASEVAALRALVTRQTFIPEPAVAAGQANRYVDLSPWATDALPAPIVISSWGHQLQVSSADDPRLQAFIDTFRASRTYSPEYGAPVDGVPVRTGGRPAMDGGAVPNPDGTAAG